ncbi:hypothetical protein KIH75_02425 [Bifidobacterium sp. 64T4]|uniref:hypothetical protein n=1 Tax=Bifidobacterium pongonis TaxID=2834432 RepID=UPI001C580B56|nr:hypothetical protein [Bifidobacterium pongonis]MBW3094224.1 hypothetical protein [Bifidobacterium pongonis]
MNETTMNVDATILFRMSNGLMLEWHADACSCLNGKAEAEETDLDWLARCLAENTPSVVRIALSEPGNH